MLTKLMVITNFGKNIERVLGIVVNSEQFLLDRYSKLYSLPPKGFRIELYAAKRFTSICYNLKQYSDIYHSRGKIADVFSLKKRETTNGNSQMKRCKVKIFCQYCEKSVEPKRLHTLDYGDIVLALFTGGFWVIFIIVIYIFLRKCPVCNNSLRGMKPQKS
ncbi:MAG: hypothetical protein ACUZ8H_07215 [Candidatus Anammoxibacter sp.]